MNINYNNDFNMLKLFIIFIVLEISSNQICQEGISNCLSCNPITNLCGKCDKDIYEPDDKGGCQLSKKCEIGKNHCLECSEETNLCSKCEEGYFYDEIGRCSYTDNCIASERGKCIICKDNYILIGNEIQICKYLNSEDFKNCHNISLANGLCEACEEGYFLNEGDKKCTKTEYCYESSFGICQRCSYFYYLNKKEDICVLQKENFYNCKESLDGTVCDSCNDNFYLSEDRKCSNTNYCLESSNYYCKKCISGYFLTEKNNVCTDTENCANGKEDLGICIECKNGFVLDFKDGKCKSNKEDNEYKYCEIAKGNCIKCLEGYYLSEDNKCSITENCSEVENGNCIACSDNYYLGLDKKCTNVEHCIYSDNLYRCEECEDNYCYNMNDNICSLAEGKLKDCKSSEYGLICKTCKNDFYLNQSDYTCKSNSNPNFYKCSKLNIYNICTECLNGYYLGKKYHNCSSINGCAKEENNTHCLECDENYCLNDKTGKCEPNDKIENEKKKFFYKCNNTNKEGTACENCLIGYILNDQGLCIDESHCIEKNGEGNCSKCEEEGKSIYCLNNIFGCISSFYINCLECNNILDFNNCTKCIEGYKIGPKGQCIEII